MEEQSDTHPELLHAMCGHSQSPSYSCHQASPSLNSTHKYGVYKEREEKNYPEQSKHTQ